MADFTRHPDAVDLAEYAEGVLDASRQQAVEDHVRDCADCSTVLTDLAGVPELLAQVPIPPMPDDVATRLDQAIAAESAARASEWSGAAARVTPIRRPRRWLAPLAAAAAVIAVVAIAIPVVNNADSGDDDASGDDTSAVGAGQESAEDEAGSAPDGRVPAAAAPSEPVSLSRASFGQDVIDAFYPGEKLSVLSRNPQAAEMDARLYYESQLEGQCPVDDAATPYGEVTDILLDGQPAYLLLNHPGIAADAVAFTCDGAEANLLADASLGQR
ncbi:MAG TPA: zf-HC2 domain-containing protein [Nocardioidaceae bacterium]|nr:zf-HC2 domain-containing protein [Nocardioidaceae bacterium]